MPNWPIFWFLYGFRFSSAAAIRIMRKFLLISDSRDSAMKREVRLVLQDALYSVTNGTRCSGAGERAGGLTVECEREEKGGR